MQKGHLVLTVKDLEKAKKWYAGVFQPLSFKIAYEDEEKMYFEVGNFPLYLAVFQGHDEFDHDTFNRYRIGFHHLGISVASKETVDEFYNHLIRQNVTITEPPQHYPEYGDELYYAVFFNDPDGLRLEVFFEEK